METKPFVSVITPTYNRRRFIPAAIACFNHQTYPKDRMEWIVLDDGSDSVEDLFTAAAIQNPNIRYIRHPTKLNIGAKRNILNREAKGDIIVCMDDDDYYPPERVATAVNALRAKPKVELAGSSELYYYFSDLKEIWRIGPWPTGHTTAGPLAYKKSYARSHQYDENCQKAEEPSFLEYYKNPLIQMDSRKCMLVICHSENTHAKKQMIQSRLEPLPKKTAFKLKDFIKDQSLRDFYANA